MNRTQTTGVEKHPKHLRQRHQRASRRRRGKVLVLLSILMPALFGIAGLVFDGGMMMDERRALQHAADAAATAAARDLREGKSVTVAIETAKSLIRDANGFSEATTDVNIPPTSGPFAGQEQHVEVITRNGFQLRFVGVLGELASQTLYARAVAGVKDATDEAAVVVYDRDPLDLTYPSISDVLALADQVEVSDDAIEQSGALGIIEAVPLLGPAVSNLLDAELATALPATIDDAFNSVTVALPNTALPTLVAGMEVEGIGQLKVDGAIHVNNEWGAFDENGEPAGTGPGPPYGVSCMPIVPTTKTAARDIRVVGGVEDESHYLPFDPDDPNPLRANCLPVPDPLNDLPVPSLVSDPTSVVTSVHDPADLVVVALSVSAATDAVDSVLGALPPLLKPLFEPLMDSIVERLTEVTIGPGVYDSITVIAPLGGVTFEPGVYTVRSSNPATLLSVCIVGPVQAEGVMFYVTDSVSFDPSTGLPDTTDDHESPPENEISGLLPSVVIAPLLASGRLAGLNEPGSPFNGMLVYQRRLDRRPIVVEAQQLIGSGDISGTVYSKWGHTVFAGGNGSYDLRFATGTMRVLTIGNTTIAPTDLFPPARDVFLLE